MAFVAIVDLIDCLEDYFAGQLNHVPVEYLHRIWLPPNRLIPGEPLKSVVDTDMMARALMGISNDCYYYLHYAYQGKNDEVVSGEVQHYFYQSGTEQSFLEWCEAMHVRSLLALAESLYKLL